MRIAIDARLYGTEKATGIGQYIKQLTDHLFKIDDQNDYVLFMLEPEFSRFVIPNERVQKVKVTAPWYSYAEQIKLPFELAREKFDLIHYPHFNSPIFFTKRSICTIHDLTPFYFDGHRMKSPWRRWAHRLVFRSTIAKASTILTVSEATKEELIKKFNVPKNKIRVTYEGVDERFKVIDNNVIIKEALDKYGITSPFILYVGAWRNHKNLERLVEAFDLIKEKHPSELQLVLAGTEDPNYPNIRQKINLAKFKHDIITPGYIESQDLPLLYNAAKMFVLPSFIEGFGLVAIEAQKCGCPVIASNTTSLPEVLGDSALFFNPENTLDLAEQIRVLLNVTTKAEELRQLGLQNVARFSWEQLARETYQSYQKIFAS